MAGIRISNLSPVPSAQLTDVFPVVQAGVTQKENMLQLLDLFNANIQISESQVTNLTADLDGKVNRSGDTMTGFLILNADPVLPLGAVTKQYADAISSGITVLLAVFAASTGNYVATYNNGASGVGATLENADVQSAFTIDGTSPVVGDRVLIKDQTIPEENGVYEVTDVGSGSTNWILTRTTDYDTAAEILPGTLFFVNNGTVNTGSGWIETATVTTVGTDPIIFSPFGASPDLFLLKANNLSDLTDAPTALINIQNSGYGILSISGITTLIDADFGKEVVCTGSSAYTVTLPSASGNAERFIDFSIRTTSFAIVTLQPASGTIMGQSSFLLGSNEGCRVVTDGTNYFVTNLFLQPVNCRVGVGVAQNVVASTFTKIRYTTVKFDVGNFYDQVTNFRYTPKYPGKYEVNMSLIYSNFGVFNFQSNIIQNYPSITDAAYNYVTNATLGNVSGTPTCIFILNGSTDFIEGFTQQGDGSSPTTKTILPNPSLNYMTFKRISNF